MDSNPLLLSIIIPCRNDSAALAENLPAIFAGLEKRDEVIVADASDDTGSATVARQYGATVVNCDKAGRGFQMNAGAAASRGGVLVFSHADTRLTASHLAALRKHFKVHPEADAGAFFKDTAAHYPAFARVDFFVRWWMGKFGVVYGDQSVFMRRSRFDALGGFADIPLMEDVAMSLPLRRSAGFRLIDPPLRTSMRGFARRGRLFTRIRNVLFVILFRCGVSPQRLYQWYYGKPVDARGARS